MIDASLFSLQDLNASGPDREETRANRPLREFLWRILYILFSLEVGIFFLFFPWLGIWENNYVLFRFPQLRPIMMNEFLKGAVIGLGIVNIVIGIQEIVQFKRNYRKDSIP